jgi:hypothetical protein
VIPSSANKSLGTSAKVSIKKYVFDYEINKNQLFNLYGSSALNYFKDNLFKQFIKI